MVDPEALQSAVTDVGTRHRSGGDTADIQRIRSERDQAEMLVLQRMVGLRALREELDEALGESVAQGRLLGISWARMAEPSGFSATGLVSRYKSRVEQTLHGMIAAQSELNTAKDSSST